MEATNSKDLNANPTIKQESNCLSNLNDDTFNLTMYLYEETISFKVAMLDTINSWENTHPLEFFRKSRAFSFAEDISEVYDAFLLKFKPDEFKIVKNENELSLSFDFVLMNKKINYVLDLKYKNPDITTEILNQIMTEIKNLRNEVKELKLENNNNKKEIRRLNLVTKVVKEAIKIFNFDNKTVFCFKIDAQKEIQQFKDFNKLHDLDWYSPDSSQEANTIIHHFYTNFSQHYLENQNTWMITFGVKTDPNNKKVGDYVINSDGAGAHGGDDGISGKCNGTGFTAFRKVASSFANPQTFGKLCNWDSGYKHSIILLQSAKK